MAMDDIPQNAFEAIGIGGMAQLTPLQWAVTVGMTLFMGIAIYWMGRID